jgi:hypothetical protein
MVRLLHMPAGMKLCLATTLASLPLIACTPDTNDITVSLAPEVISSLDGNLQVHVEAIADRQPGVKKNVEVAVKYTDRNGAAHMVTAIDGVTDEKGSFDAAFTGLTWDGYGTVTASVLAGGPGSSPLMIGGAPLSAEATFSVLDRTPPKVTITPPTGNNIHTGVQGNQVDNLISVHVTDEIGVSNVLFQTDQTNNQNGVNIRGRSQIIASGAADTTVMFDVTAGNAQVGQTVTFYALATDLSGNQAAATPITVTVVQ